MNDAVQAGGQRTPKLGLVLAGGAARGAYEVGVLEYIAEDVSRELGRDVPFEILCGTSVGAINVSCLAAWADEPRARCARLASVWTGLRIADVLRPTAGGFLDVMRSFSGRAKIETSALFNAEPLRQLLHRTIPYERIDTHLRSGMLSAVTVSATQVATGRTMVFVQRRRAHPPPWRATAAVIPRPVRLRVTHTLASAAVPLMFPAVQIDGRYYCDGGLRQNIPLSPARRLGATHMVVINPKHREEKGSADRKLAEQREEVFPSPLFLLGKTMNALLLDRIDNALDRLEKINEILDAGVRRYGDEFLDGLNEELGYEPGKGLRKLRTVYIHASENIGELSADHVRSDRFHMPGMLGKLMKRLAEGEATREADVLSYLLFDGDFASQLVDLGRQDARRHHAQLCELFDEVLTLQSRMKV